MNKKQVKILVFLGVLILMGTYIGLIPKAYCQTSLGDQIQQLGQQLSQQAQQAESQAQQAASSLSQQAQQAESQAQQAASSFSQQAQQAAQQAESQAQQAASSFSQQAQQAAQQAENQAQQAASSYSQQLNQQLNQIISSAESQTQQQGTQAENDLSDWISQVSQAASQDLQAGVNLAMQSTGEYQQQAWNVISLEAQVELSNNYNTPQAAESLCAKRDLITEVTITAIKLVPIYDEDTGQVETFDGFASNLVSETPALAGSDLASDPVRCVSLMMLDGNYLNYAKIIQTPDGSWISIQQALTTGYRTSDVNAAQSELTAAQQAYQNNDPQQIETDLTSFSSTINSINNSQSYSPETNSGQETAPSVGVNSNQNAQPASNNSPSLMTTISQDTSGLGQDLAAIGQDILNLISSIPPRWFALMGIVIAVGVAGECLVQRKKKQNTWEESI
jgi:DNA polymerase III alpha subunit (gram-positive type)